MLRGENPGYGQRELEDQAAKMPDCGGGRRPAAGPAARLAGQRQHGNRGGPAVAAAGHDPDADVTAGAQCADGDGGRAPAGVPNCCSPADSLIPGELSFRGPMAESNIRSLRFDTAVVTPCAVNLNDGLLAHDLEDAAVKRAGLESAGRVMVACSGCKWNASAMALVAALDAVDVLVTDKDLSRRRTRPAQQALGGSSECMSIKTGNAPAAQCRRRGNLPGFRDQRPGVRQLGGADSCRDGNAGHLPRARWEPCCCARPSGSLLALPTAGHVVGRIGTANAVRVPPASWPPGPASVWRWPCWQRSIPGTAVALFFFGMGIGLWDVSQNIEGADVEHKLGRTIMPQFHAAFSGGAFLGALIGAGLSGLGVGLPAAPAGDRRHRGRRDAGRATLLPAAHPGRPRRWRGKPGNPRAARPGGTGGRC